MGDKGTTSYRFGKTISISFSFNAQRISRLVGGRGENDGGDSGSGIVIIRYAYADITPGTCEFIADKIELEEEIPIGSGQFFTFDADVFKDNNKTITVKSGGMFNNQTGTRDQVIAERQTGNSPGEGWHYLSAPAAMLPHL